MNHKFEDIVSVDNFLAAYKEFIKGKMNKRDVRDFSFCLMDNIFLLHKDVVNYEYNHGGYQAFKVSDPKPRTIHKASVRDRLLHRAMYRILYPFFDRTFISDSFSCRNDKGTHSAIRRFNHFGHIVSKNNTKTCWVLKCDIRKFFASINQQILLKILRKYIIDEKIIQLLEKIICSFYSVRQGVGLPLGNLTSQLFANIYMNEFDQFIKHKMKIKHYIRYADDFVFLSENKNYLESIIPAIADFLEKELKLSLHPNKVFIETLFSGVDFLGCVNFSNYSVLRNSTKKRMMKRMKIRPMVKTLSSYIGLLSHSNNYKLRNKILEPFIENYDKFV
ncbi:MAG: reverse transcriptase/maturase family protein [Candidatus Pacebacteria bacterium]|nr:reverse transcriptase/maturase family protein [Candidatus Paceibacterota bacterium]